MWAIETFSTTQIARGVIFSLVYNRSIANASWLVLDAAKVGLEGMEASRKRKAPSATPTTTDGSASKKLKLLVRIILFDKIAVHSARPRGV